MDTERRGRARPGMERPVRLIYPYPTLRVSPSLRQLLFSLSPLQGCSTEAPSSLRVPHRFQHVLWTGALPSRRAVLRALARPRRASFSFPFFAPTINLTHNCLRRRRIRTSRARSPR